MLQWSNRSAGNNFVWNTEVLTKIKNAFMFYLHFGQFLNFG